MTPEQFQSAFLHIAGTRFNWRRFRAESWPVELSVVTDHSELGQVRVPWYRVDGEGVPGHDDRAQLARVDEIADNMHNESVDARRRVFGFAVIFAKTSRGVCIALPAFRLAPGDSVVMDGTHRLIGLYLSGNKNWSVLLYEVVGPVEAGAHWDAELVSPRV